MPVYTKLFGAFFAAFCAVWFAADALRGKRIRSKQWLLLAAGLVFYAYGAARFLPVLFFVIAVTYIAGRRMDGGAGTKELSLSVALVLLPLALLKYGVYCARLTGLTDRPYLIPLGISFFTLQSISYLVSVAGGKRAAEKDLLTVASFICFFPVVSSGPILRADDMLPQLKGEGGERRASEAAAGAWKDAGTGTGDIFRYERVTEGLRRWGFGLFQKLVLADALAVYIQGVRADAAAAYGTAQLAAALLYSFQIYLDFAGYSNIAAGCAIILGYRIPENFDHPYLSRSVTEFWRRWHMSLSSWLRDYVYIPLGGSRTDRPWKIYRNLLLTFLVSGIWHGAGLTFLIWGMLHGAALCAERMTGAAAGKTEQKGRETGKAAGSAAVICRTALTFLFVTLAWIFFSAADTGQAFSTIASFAGIPGELAGLLPALAAEYGLTGACRELLMIGENTHFARTMVLLAGFAACSAVTFRKGRPGTVLVREKGAAVRWAAYLTLITLVLFFSASASVNFIYNQF